MPRDGPQARVRTTHVVETADEEREVVRKSANQPVRKLPPGTDRQWPRARVRSSPSLRLEEPNGESLSTDDIRRMLGLLHA
jgi:hypothetical protein